MQRRVASEEVRERVEDHKAELASAKGSVLFLILCRLSGELVGSIALLISPATLERSSDILEFLSCNDLPRLAHDELETVPSPPTFLALNPLEE